jgi:hypothetical protein
MLMHSRTKLSRLIDEPREDFRQRCFRTARDNDRCPAQVVTFYDDQKEAPFIVGTPLQYVACVNGSVLAIAHAKPDDEIFFDLDTCVWADDGSGIDPARGERNFRLALACSEFSPCQP